MKDEKVQNVTEQAVEQNSVNAEEQAAVASGMKRLERIDNGICLIPEIRISRAEYTRNGQKFYAPVAYGMRKGKEQQIRFIAGNTYDPTTRKSRKDKNIYDQINLIFEECTDFHLGIRWKTNVNGYTVPEVFFVGYDSYYEDYEIVPLEFMNDSDKLALEGCFKDLRKRLEFYIPSLI